MIIKISVSEMIYLIKKAYQIEDADENVWEDDDEYYPQSIFEGISFDSNEKVIEVLLDKKKSDEAIELAKKVKGDKNE